MQEFKVGDEVLVEAKIININGKLHLYEVSAPCAPAPFWVDTVYPISPSKTYEDGLNDAWKVARLIGMQVDNGGLSTTDLYTIFGTEIPADIFRGNTAQDAIEKITTWEDEAIHVGDVVLYSRDHSARGLVTAIEDGHYTVLWSDGECEYYSPQDLVKTSRSIDISVLLEEIGRAG